MPSDNLSALPLEQQIGQLFFIGLPGTALDEQTGKLIEEVKPGGIIIFGRNVESPQQLRGLLDGARALLPVAPLCGIDQEGGLVDRLREIFPPMPSARAIRQHGDLAAARRSPGQVGPPEEGQRRSRGPQPVSKVNVVGVRDVEVDCLLDEAKPQHADVEVHVALHVAGDGGHVMDPGNVLWQALHPPFRPFRRSEPASIW